MYNALRSYATPSPTPSNASTSASTDPSSQTGGLTRPLRRLKWLPAELEEVYSVGFSLPSVVSGSGVSANGSQAEWDEARRSGVFKSGAGERSVTALRNKFAQLRKERSAAVGQVFVAPSPPATMTGRSATGGAGGGGGSGDDDEYIPPEPSMPFTPPSAGQGPSAAAQSARPARPRSGAPRRARKKADSGSGSGSGSELVVEEEPFDVTHLFLVPTPQRHAAASAQAANAHAESPTKASVQTQVAPRRLDEGVEWSAAEDAALLASICTLPSGMLASSPRLDPARPTPPTPGPTSVGEASTPAYTAASTGGGTVRPHDIAGWNRLRGIVSRTYELLENDVPFSRTPEEVEARWENRWKSDWSSGWSPLTTSLFVSALIKASIELSQIGLKPETVLGQQQASARDGSARKTDVPNKAEEKVASAATVPARMALSPPPTPAAAKTAAHAAAAVSPIATATSSDPRLRARAQAQMRRPPQFDSSRAASPPSLVTSSLDVPKPERVPQIAASGRAAPPFPVRKTPTPDRLWLTPRTPASVSMPPASTHSSPSPSPQPKPNLSAGTIAEEPATKRPTVWMSTPADTTEPIDPPEIADNGIGLGLGIDFGHEAEKLTRAPKKLEPALPTQLEQDCPPTAPAEESDCDAQSEPPPAASQGTEEDEIKLVPVPSVNDQANRPLRLGNVPPDPPSAAAPPAFSTRRLSAESSSWYSRTNTCKPFSDLPLRAHVQLVPRPIETFDVHKAATATVEAPASPVSIKATSEPFKPFSKLTPSPPKKSSVPSRSSSTSLNRTPTRPLPTVLSEVLGHTPGHVPKTPFLPPVADWYQELAAAEERAKCGTKRSSPEAEEIWPVARRAFNPDRIGKGEDVMLSDLTDEDMMHMPARIDDASLEHDDEQRYRTEYEQYLERHLVGDFGGTMPTLLDWAIAAGRPLVDPPREATPDGTDDSYGEWQPFEHGGRADFASSTTSL